MKPFWKHLSMSRFTGIKASSCTKRLQPSCNISPTRHDSSLLMRDDFCILVRRVQQLFFNMLYNLLAFRTWKLEKFPRALEQISSARNVLE
eukprot:g62894.t1